MEEVEEIWERAEKAMERVGVTDERAIKGAFRRKLRGAVFGKGGKRTPKEFLGFVFGASKLIDWDEFRRIKALNKYRDNPEKAVLDGFVDEAGNPLDEGCAT